ncbi:MAG: hypothetical protein ABR981_01380 [Candidatus Micrarchaeaceae archaeon]|jgi:hypothetical protein
MNISNNKQSTASAEIEKPSKVVQNTNLYTTYFRSFSDIPLAAEFAKLIRAEEAYEQDKAIMGNIETRIPWFEARYKAIDTLIKSSGVDQVVEFAAGRSLRGIINPQWNFVHTDQDPEALEQMWCYAKKLLTKQGRMPAFVGFDAISGEGFENITQNLSIHAPIAVVHEGLYTYYPHPTKEKIAINAKMLLEKYGGFYITPDIHHKEEMAEWNKLGARSEEQKKNWTRKFSRDLESFYFTDREESHEFFTRLGFVYEIYSMGELVSDLSSTRKLFTDPDKIREVDEATKRMNIWKMSLRK